MSRLADQLMACRTAAELYRLLIKVECDDVPAEIAAALRADYPLPADVRSWLGKMRTMMFSQADAVQPYWRRRISANVALYSTREAQEPRDLLIAFCGLSDRLQAPLPVILQHIDGARFDVLVLRDPTKRIYLRGVPGYGDDAALVAESIRRDMDLRRYRSVRAFGTSGGGWVAFTVGALLGAERAISLSGMPPTATFRLSQAWGALGYSLDEQEADFAVFERIFNAIPDRSTPLLAIYGGAFEQDRLGAEGFEKLVGATGIGFEGVDSHNLLARIMRRNLLRSFFDRYFLGDLDRIVPPPGQRMVPMECLEEPLQPVPTP